MKIIYFILFIFLLTQCTVPTYKKAIEVYYLDTQTPDTLYYIGEGEHIWVRVVNKRYCLPALEVNGEIAATNVRSYKILYKKIINVN